MSYDLILPTDEQVERACSTIAESIQRNWSSNRDFFDPHERLTWRAQARSMLVVNLNIAKIMEDPDALQAQAPR